MLTAADISSLVAAVHSPFYLAPDFWIGTVIGLLGLGFSLLAFREARAAKNAAFEAGKTVKIQTITIELTEIAQRLDKLDFNLNFSEARDLLNELSRRLLRLIAPFQNNDDLVTPCKNLKAALESARSALDQLRPSGGGVVGQTPNAIYFGIQGHLSIISSLVAEIMGLFEKRTIDRG